MAVNQSYAISAAVGAQPGAANLRQDVETIQILLNEYATRVGYPPLLVNGLMTISMIQAIRMFQQQVVGLSKLDGRVDPNGKTLRKLNEPVTIGTPSDHAFAPVGKPFQERLDAFLADAAATHGVTIPAGTDFRKPEDAQKWHVAHMIYFNSYASLKPAKWEAVNGRNLIKWDHLASAATIWQYVQWQDYLRDASGQVPTKQGTAWAAGKEPNKEKSRSARV